MNERIIRRPTGPAIIFLISAISFVITIFSTYILTQPGLPNTDIDLPFTGILRMLIMVVANLFMSVVLFSKKYNNLLIIATASLMINNISGYFLNVTASGVINTIFYLLLIVFTYIAIKKQGTPLREKVVKFRFIIPVFQFALITYSVIQTLQNSYERALEAVSAYPEGSVSIIPLMLPFIFSSIVSFLPVLCYIWLVNWIADPYKKKQSPTPITN